MSERSNATLGKDIRDLAEMLLVHLVAGPIIRDAGVRRVFTPDEHGRVLDIAHNSEFMEMFQRIDRDKTINSNIDGWHWNSIIAIGLARQISDGLIASVDAPEAVDLIERNMFPVDSGSERSKDRSAIPISFRLYLKIMQEFVQLPEFEPLRQAWIAGDPEEGGDPRYKLHNAFCEPGQQLLYRYGEIRRASYGSVASSMLDNDLAIDDPEIVWAHLNSFPVPMGPRFIDDRSSS